MDYTTWIQRLRVLRTTKKISQEEIALAMRISRSHYTAVEKGRVTINLKHFFYLSEYLKISLSDLIELNDYKQPTLEKSIRQNKKKIIYKKRGRPEGTRVRKCSCGSFVTTLRRGKTYVKCPHCFMSIRFL